MVGDQQNGSQGVVSNSAGSLTMRRCNVHHCSDGIVPGRDCLYEDNYVHDLSASGAPHCDTFQNQGGQRNVVIRHNTLSIQNAPGPNASFYITTQFDNISNILLDNNQLLGNNCYYSILFQLLCRHDADRHQVHE